MQVEAETKVAEADEDRSNVTQVLGSVAEGLASIGDGMAQQAQAIAQQGEGIVALAEAIKAPRRRKMMIDGETIEAVDEAVSG